MENNIKNIREKFLEKIKNASSLKELNEIFLALFGKNGEMTLLPKKFAQLSGKEKQRVGSLFNKVKEELEQTISSRREAVREEGYKKLDSEKLEVSLEKPVSPNKGCLHPITHLEKEIEDLFGKIGFQQFSAPHIDSDYYNFESLNIPENHPARDLWDTLYIDSKKYDISSGKLLLRTHTSNAQVRIMEQFKPPFRMMIIDRCFRYENLDARHEHTYDQFEIVYVDKNLSMANLQYLSEYFFKAVLGKDIKARLRPKYYPFVEPGAGVDGLCPFCKGKGCKVCGGMGWLELAGAGMIHPQVLKRGGIDPSIYSGIAWGFGPMRMAMIKYGVEDLRLFNSGDLKFLERF